MTTYAGKTVLVTGSSGIAKTLVESLWAKGANIIIVSDSDSCEKLAASLRPAKAVEESSKPEDKHGFSIADIFHRSHSSSDHGTQKAVGIRCDLSSSAAATEVAKKVTDTAKTLPGNHHGHIDDLILCAAIMPMKSLTEIDEKTWNHVFAVNVVGPVFLTQALVPSISNHGRILFFSSSLTLSSDLTPNYLSYIASKGAIEQAVRALEKDKSLSSRGITVTCDVFE